MPDDVLATGAHLRLVRRHGWEYVEHLGGAESVAALATAPGGELVLVEQWREPVARVVLELPAGIVDPGKAPRDAVVRELLEETGFAVSSPPELLLASPILAGVTSNVLHLFRVRCGPKVAGRGGIDDERITVRLVPLPELPAALAAADGVDWHLPAALHLAGISQQLW